MPGGWHYLEGEVRLDGTSLRNLYEVVRQNRLDNGIPVGDVEHDVNSQICGRFPRNCRGGEIVSESVRMSMSDGVSPLDKLVEDATAWAISLAKRREPFALLPDSHAAARYEICRSCPMNKIYRHACPTCVSNLERNSALVRQGREIRGIDRLGACAVLRHDNKTAIFLSPEMLSTSANLPDRCWLR